MSTRSSYWSLRLEHHDDILLQQLETKCKLSAYSDALMLLVEENSRRQLEGKCAELMQIAADWGRIVGVSVSVNKTVMMLMKETLSHTRLPSVLNHMLLKMFTVG